MNLLEKVLTYLRNKCEKVMLDLEKKYGKEKLMKYISDDSTQEHFSYNEQDSTADELIFLAYTGLDALEEKNQIEPSVSFFLDISKNILDTLRSNSKLIEFYNDTARKMFNFCKKYKSSKEYKRVSETLHSHFNQIMKLDREPQLNSKIPFPIKLDEEEQVTLVLKIRKEQLELAISMGEWTDAHRTSGNIYQLMGKISKKQSDKQLKDLYIEFFGHLAAIFWRSDLFLFHTYALYNISYLIKSQKTATVQDRNVINDKFILAALSIPLNNKINNFDKLSFNFVPECFRATHEKNANAREELLATSKMLQVEGFPSRNSIIQSIRMENIGNNASSFVCELFQLLEVEESPFTISKQGKASLDRMCKESPALAVYRPHIERSLSIRILQKCKSFYRNMKLSKLTALLQFYSSVTEVERLLFECNKEGLAHTTINYHSHGSTDGSITFNAESQVADNLQTFGNQLRIVFQKVQEAT